MASHTGDNLTIVTGETSPVPLMPYDMVSTRFDGSIALAERMLELLIGSGNGGYLGELKNLLREHNYNPGVAYVPVDTTAVTLTTVPNAPTFDNTNIAPYPSVAVNSPSLRALPIVDTSGLVAGSAPSAGSTDISWTSSSYSSGVYADLLARILSDLQSGSTGLSPVVEQATYDRAIARNQAANSVAYAKLNDDVSSRRFSMPSGALAGALADLSMEIVRQETDINNQIIVSQGELAQKNSQFIIQQAVALEQLLRVAHSESENRELDKAKSIADMIVRKYAEDVRLYLADMEAKKNYVEAQAENLRATIEANKGLIEIYKTEYEAIEIRVNAIAAQNKSVVDVFMAEMQGFGEQVRAFSAADANKLALLQAKLEDAKNSLDGQVAAANAYVEDFKAESGLKAAVSRDMAQIAQQAVASALNSVSATAGISYSGHESVSESIGRSVSISESHSYEDYEGA